MTAGPGRHDRGPRDSGPGGAGPDLIAGELRGYRQFDLRPDGLYPLVHSEDGPWDGRLQRARCAARTPDAAGSVEAAGSAGGDDGWMGSAGPSGSTGAVPSGHDAPAAGCRCGLYGWYLPGSATVALGPAGAVVAVRGRCILGDRGFRAAEGRVEAVALPAAVRWNPRAARRARAMLAERYPDTTVYPSARRMIAAHPPQDVSGLGIHPPADHSRGYRAAAVGLGVALLPPAYALAVVPRDDVAAWMTTWWPLLVLLAIGWQVAMVWLLTRLLALQASGP